MDFFNNPLKTQKVLLIFRSSKTPKLELEHKKTLEIKGISLACVFSNSTLNPLMAGDTEKEISKATTQKLTVPLEDFTMDTKTLDNEVLNLFNTLPELEQAAIVDRLDAVSTRLLENILDPDVHNTPKSQTVPTLLTCSQPKSTRIPVI